MEKPKRENSVPFPRELTRETPASRCPRLAFGFRPGIPAGDRSEFRPRLAFGFRASLAIRFPRDGLGRPGSKFSKFFFRRKTSLEVPRVTYDVIRAIPREKISDLRTGSGRLLPAG